MTFIVLISPAGIEVPYIASSPQFTRGVFPWKIPVLTRACFVTSQPLVIQMS